MTLIPLWAKALIVAALVAALAGGIHLYNQGIRDTQRAIDVAEYNVKLLAAEESARAQEAKWKDQIKGAQDEAAKLRKDKDAAAAANSVVVGRLSGQLANLSSGLSTASITACRARASALSAVFGECSDRLTALGDAAQGQYADSIECRRAWPR